MWNVWTSFIHNTGHLKIHPLGHSSVGVGNGSNTEQIGLVEMLKNYVFSLPKQTLVECLEIGHDYHLQNP